MKFVLVNGRTPRPESFCALCCEPIGQGYLRELATRLSGRAEPLIRDLSSLLVRRDRLTPRRCRASGALRWTRSPRKLDRNELG